MTSVISLGSASAHATDIGALLRQVCEPDKVFEAKCLQVTGYPNKAGDGACDLTWMSGAQVEGHFLSKETTQLLLSYRSSCEPHSSNFGGTAVFDVVKEGVYQLSNYQPGLILSNALKVENADQVDRLIVKNATGQGGSNSQSIAEVHFVKGEDNKLGYTQDLFVKANSNSGYYGVEVLPCVPESESDYAMTYLKLKDVGKEPGTVVFNASYADAELLKASCTAENREKMKEKFGGVGMPLDSLPESEAAVEFLKSDDFILNLETRAITRVETEE